MQKAQRQKIWLLCALPVAVSLTEVSAAERTSSQSFKPIEIEEATASNTSLYLSWHTPLKAVTVAQPLDSDGGGALNSIFAIQVSQLLHSQWRGRIGFFVSRSGGRAGDPLWSFIGSDLQHTVLPSTLDGGALFGSLKPYAYFGLGFASRWENSQVRYNVIPTFRYEESEPAAYTGLSFLFPGFGHLLLEFDVRLVQSARTSQNRFLMLGGSVVLGQWERH